MVWCIIVYMHIQPYADNAKKHPKSQIEQIAKSIERFGMNQPIVIDNKGIIIVGHGRYQALQHLGWEIKDEYIKQLDNLTPQEVNAYRLADNKLNESDWEMDLVIEELRSLDDPELQLLTGFDMDLLLEPEEADDAVPDTPEEPKSKLGDLYQLGPHRVLCGDSTKLEDVERLMDGKKADMVFTDPPYGMSVVKNNKVGADFGVAKKGSYSEVIGDDTLEVAEDFYNLCVSLDYKRYIIWGGNYFMKFLPLSTGWIIWDKRGDTGIRNTFADGEMAWTNFQKQVRIYKQLWNGMIREGEKDKRLHPTQKPIKILSDILLEYTTNTEVILDAFLGSGSTLIACEKTGRTCYGLELDPKYVDVIVQRYVDYVDNPMVVLDGKDVTSLWTKTMSKTK